MCNYKSSVAEPHSRNEGSTAAKTIKFIDGLRSLCPDPIDMNSVSMNSQSALAETKQRLSIVTVSPTLATNDFRVTQVATAKSL